MSKTNPQFEYREQRCADLVCGYENEHGLRFRHKSYDQRSPAAQAQYDRLKAHLSEHGMLNPIITYKGHVLIGQRRFEIVKETQETIPTLEVLEPLHEWRVTDVTALTNAVKIIYHQNTPNMPRNL